MIRPAILYPSPDLESPATRESGQQSIRPIGSRRKRAEPRAAGHLPGLMCSRGTEARRHDGDEEEGEEAAVAGKGSGHLRRGRRCSSRAVAEGPEVRGFRGSSRLFFGWFASVWFVSTWASRTLRIMGSSLGPDSIHGLCCWGLPIPFGQ